MAEAIEINFPTESDKNPKIDSELKNQILGFDVKESMEQDKNQESCPEEYTIFLSIKGPIVTFFCLLVLKYFMC